MWIHRRGRRRNSLLAPCVRACCWARVLAVELFVVTRGIGCWWCWCIVQVEQNRQYFDQHSNIPSLSHDILLFLYVYSPYRSTDVSRNCLSPCLHICIAVSVLPSAAEHLCFYQVLMFLEIALVRVSVSVSPYRGFLAHHSITAPPPPPPPPPPTPTPPTGAIYLRPVLERG
jgi:hypothetical protein